MKTIRQCILWMYTLCYCLVVDAQFYDIERYADDNILPARIVSCSLQDADGYLWVGTFNGLYKFDGQQFKAYRQDINDTHGLRSNRIRKLYEDFNKRLWIGTDTGLHYLENDSIYYYEPPAAQNNLDHINFIGEDALQNLWVGTSWGAYYASNDGTQQYYYEDIKESTVYDIYQDADYLWASTSEGLFLRNLDNNSFKKVDPVLVDDGSVLTDMQFFQIKRLNNNLLIAGTNYGLVGVSFDQDDNVILRRFEDKKGNPIGRDVFPYDIDVDSEGVIWVSTYQQKFQCYTWTNGYLEKKEIHVNGGLQGMKGHVLDLQIDRQKNIWLSNANGLYRMTISQNPLFTFPPAHIDDCLGGTFSVYDVYVESEYIWISNNNGLYRFDKSDILNRRCPTHFLHLKNAEFTNANDIKRDAQNRMWISSKNGMSIIEFDAKDDPATIHRFTTEQGLPSNWVYRMSFSNDSTTWMGTYLGLVRMEFSSNLKDVHFTTYTSEKDNPNSLANTTSYEVNTTNDNTLWVGTYSGLARLDDESFQGSFSNYLNNQNDVTSISSNSIKSLFTDHQNTLWIGTQTGLNRYDPQTDSFIRYGYKDGLPSEYILGIEQDHNGNLWIASTGGIVKAFFDNISTEFLVKEVYGLEDGMLDKITFKNALSIDDTGHVFAGGAKGLHIIKPKDIESSSSTDSFTIKIDQFNTSAKSGKGFNDHLDMITTNDIKLEHFENSIQLHFAFLDLSNPKNNLYRYKLLPQNSDWIHTGQDSKVTLLNLARGSYELMLEASDRNSNWIGNITKLNITICPPWWKSTIAWIIYGTIFLTGLGYWYRTRVMKRIKIYEEELRFEKALNQQREKLRKENAADFHDELGNKITKISLFLSLLERGLDSKNQLYQYIEKIRTNTSELATGFRDLLWVIDPTKDSVNDTFLRLKDFGEELFRDSNCEFNVVGFNHDLDNVLLEADVKKHTILIFKEAMNNSVKYANGSKAVLNISFNGSLKIGFKDNGKGFDQGRSNGRGLKNMESRASKIGANIEMTSQVSSGTRITLDNIPHQKEQI